MNPLPVVLNTQPPEPSRYPPDPLTGGLVEVVGIWPTIQGEGPFAGDPAVFLRLAGCNLKCPGCDTNYTSNRRWLTVDEAVQEIHETGFTAQLRSDLVVITGGEPFRQPIAPLVRELVARGVRVQIETNGTIYQEDFPWSSPYLSVVCSPKTSKVDEDLYRYLKALKYVGRAGALSEVDGLPLDVLGSPHAPWRPTQRSLGNILANMGVPPAALIRRDVPIYLQPMDEGDAVRNAANAYAVSQACMKFGYRLSIQLHKVVGLD